jgi:hypothetical protein
MARTVRVNKQRIAFSAALCAAVVETSVATKSFIYKETTLIALAASWVAIW